MPRITVILTKENEDYLRNNLKRQGDISRQINEALDKVRLGSIAPTPIPNVDQTAHGESVAV
jgi:hypothetical protein